MEAVCLIREQPAYRREAFLAGLAACGIPVVDRLKPSPETVLLIWNRYGAGAQAADEVERAGGRVVVCENGYLGREWRGAHWYAMSLGQHNGAGEWFPGGPERWDGWGVDLAPFRPAGSGETVVLPQRGIGPPGVAMPSSFFQLIGPFVGMHRVREHPGENVPVVSLEDDLANCGLAVIWGSGAGLKALAMGIPVAYWFDRWIGGPGAGFGRLGIENPNRNETERLDMFRRMAWGMWNVDEIAAGTPFRHLLLR